MQKTAIIYASTHHGNTYKLVKAISDKYSVDMMDATKQTKADLTDYDIIGFASGIDFGKFYPSVEQFAKDNLPEGKKVFFLYTCAMARKGFTDSMRDIANQKECKVMGEYGCKGFNTYGPWKLIGGMNKKHPNRQELSDAVSFYETLLK